MSMKKLMKASAFSTTLLVLGIFMAGCDGQDVIVTSPYPYETAEYRLSKAQEISDTLTAYIKDWKAGKVAAELPKSVLPPGCWLQLDDTSVDNYANIKYTLVNPDTMNPDAVMFYRKAEVINQSALHGFFPDPHCTYAMTNTFLAPFGTTVTIKGQYPHCRYFSFTAPPPFNTICYVWNYEGDGEVCIGDADIEPDAGSVNPFRVGANRNATARNYTITLVTKIGNQAQETYNGVKCIPPNFRAPGNMRYCSGFWYAGPGGYGNSTYETGKAVWATNSIWMRYYLPDNYGKPGFDWKAGVPTPKFSSALSSGEKFWITADQNFISDTLNTTKEMTAEDPKEPWDGPWEGQTWGWKKYLGVALNGLAYIQIYNANAYDDPAQKKWVRDAVLGFSGKGQSQPAPGNWFHAPTHDPHIHYMSKGLSVGENKVSVLTGKLPTFPKTRDGQATMTGGQMRYFSLTSTESDLFAAVPGCAKVTMCDEDIVVDANRNYVICFSRPSEKPSNATSANGVTWVDIGANNASCPSFMRWIAMAPEWGFEKTPDQALMNWETIEWSSPNFNNALIGENKRTGIMGEYLPVTSYMDRCTFENISGKVTWAKIAACSWNQVSCSSGGCGASMVSGPTKGLTVILPLLVGMFIGLIGAYKRFRT